MAAVQTSITRSPSRRPRSAIVLIILSLLAALLCVGLSALGTWQIHRLAWKRTLIAQVAQRTLAPPVSAPEAPDWPALTAANAEYRRVSASGTYLYDQQTLVQAATEFGSGYWVMTPLRLASGHIILINRGFVLPAWRKLPIPPSTSVISITGLLRMGESEQQFLRHNNPAIDLWYSRAPPAIAAAHGLTHVAPYFIDADAQDAATDPNLNPVGGLTQLQFSNHHLLYAITWFGLAVMVLIGMGIVAREEWRLRHPH